MTMRNLLFLFGLFIALCPGCSNGHAQRPNVIVILADDIGQGDISHYRRLHLGQVVLETPNIDALAEAGMVFTDAHSPAALCAPSRYAFMTGNNCYRSYAPWGVWGSYEQSPIRDADLTLGRLMKRAGYHTAFFGKWHLGGDFYRLSDPETIYRAPRVQPELDVDIRHAVDGPPQKGFDYSFTFPAGIQDVPYAVFENGNMILLEEDSEIVHITQEMMDSIDVVLDKDEGLGDSNWDPHEMGPLLAGKAVDYIRAHAAQEDPFFMYYCSQAVHLPHTPPDSLNGQAIAGSTPVDHMDMIRELDVQMGMLVDALKEEGVYENTVFIFTSDNGGLTRSATQATGHKPSSIYRGGKNSCYEGGHRVPLIVNWPASVSPGSACSAPVSGTDLMATLASITATEIRANEAMDSHDFLPHLLEEENAPTRDFLTLQSGTGNELIYIEDGWKLIIQTDRYGNARDPEALFNLNANPSENEAQNYIDSPAQEERIASMLASYNRIRDSRIATKNYSSISLPHDHAHIYSEGRIARETESAVLTWPGTMLSLEFLGESLSATLEDQKGDNYFNVIVDGEAVQVLKLEKGEHSYGLAEGLSHGVHTVELHKRNDWSFGWTRFYGFQLNGIETYAQDDKAQFIEFYGNSITTGYGNEDYEADRSTGDVTNNYLAYGALTARNLGMEYSCISHSGIGILVSWHELIMNEEYNRIAADDATNKWDYSKKQADYVVVNLFQNDSWLVDMPDHSEFKRRFGTEKPSEEEIIGAYEEFLGLIRTAYPKAPIVCMLGNMDITQNSSPWPGYVEEAAARKGGKIHTLFVPYKDSPGHPKLEEQQLMADRLTAFIRELSDTLSILGLELRNGQSGEAIKGAGIQMGGQAYTSDHKGMLSQEIAKGQHQIHIQAERYADTTFTVAISSDTLFRLSLRQTIADAKMVVKKDGSPVHGATVQLDGSTASTSTVGIVNFYNLPTGSALDYEISQGESILESNSLTLHADSTLRFDFSTLRLAGDPLAGFHLYPVPARSTLHVEGLESGSTYRIVDMGGKQVAEGRTMGQIDTSSLGAGTYLFHAEERAPVKFSIE